jgi:hypothetical protein
MIRRVFPAHAFRGIAYPAMAKMEKRQVGLVRRDLPESRLLEEAPGLRCPFLLSSVHVPVLDAGVEHRKRDSSDEGD